MAVATVTLTLSALTVGGIVVVRLPQLLALTTDRNVERVLKSCGYFQRMRFALVVRSIRLRNLEGNIHLHSHGALVPRIQILFEE